MLTDYEILKMQPDRGLLKGALCLMILLGVTLMGTKADLQSEARSDPPGVSAQDLGSGDIVEAKQVFDEQPSHAADERIAGGRNDP